MNNCLRKVQCFDRLCCCWCWLQHTLYRRLVTQALRLSEQISLERNELGRYFTCAPAQAKHFAEVLHDKFG